LALDVGEKEDGEDGCVLYVLDGKLTVVFDPADSTVISAWHGPPESSEVSKSQTPHYWVDYHENNKGLICPNCSQFRSDVFEAVGKIGAECCGRLYPPKEWIEPTPERVRLDMSEL
jgi:hypothetical protein